MIRASYTGPAAPGCGDCPARPGSDRRMHAVSVVTVCMGGLLDELREFLPSARLAFPGLPIHVYTDRGPELWDLLATLPVGEIRVHPTPAVEGVDLGRVARHSDYWQPWPIYWKIAALREQVADLPPGAEGGVLLADCDITFREGFERNYHGDVVLSPFYWGRRDIRVGGALLQHRDGEYNAGLLLTRSMEFCQWWMEAYLSGLGGFYEQGCLDLVPGLFPTDYFSPLHNWGKWRFAAPHPEVRSYHQHLAERSLRPDIGAIKIAAQRAAAEARAQLREEAPA